MKCWMRLKRHKWTNWETNPMSRDSFYTIRERVCSGCGARQFYLRNPTLKELREKLNAP